MGDLFTIGSLVSPEKVKPILLDDHSDTFTSMNKTKFSWQSFLDETVGKEINENWW